MSGDHLRHTLPEPGVDIIILRFNNNKDGSWDRKSSSPSRRRITVTAEAGRKAEFVVFNWTTANIEHRLIKPRTPKMNGMVGRFNGGVAEVLDQTRSCIIKEA